MEITENNAAPDNMRSYFDFGVFGYIPPDKSKIHYLAYEYGTSKSQESNPQSKGIPELALKLKVRDIELVTESVTVDTRDELYSISNHVIDKAFARLVEAADKNRVLANDKFPTGIDFEPKGQGDHRRLLARILATSNMVATMCRRGPANFVLVSESVYKQIFFPEHEPSAHKFYSPTSNVAGLNFFISPVGNKIVVGRRGKEDEPGIFIQCKEPAVADYKLNENHEINQVDASYAIEEVGDMLPYISFNILE